MNLLNNLQLIINVTLRCCHQLFPLSLAITIVPPIKYALPQYLFHWVTCHNPHAPALTVSDFTVTNPHAPALIVNGFTPTPIHLPHCHWVYCHQPPCTCPPYHWLYCHQARWICPHCHQLYCHQPPCICSHCPWLYCHQTPSTCPQSHWVYCHQPLYTQWHIITWLERTLIKAPTSKRFLIRYRPSSPRLWSLISAWDFVRSWGHSNIYV